MRDIQYRDEGRPDDLLQELGYETQDIAYRKFAQYMGFFYGFFIVCIILGFVFMWFMVPTRLSGGRMGDYTPKVAMPVATPLLQSNITARTDIMSLRRKETAEMTTPAVVDQAHGVYRIPIDQAIDDVANGSDSDRAAMGLPPESANGAASTQFPGSNNVDLNADSGTSTVSRLVNSVKPTPRTSGFKLFGSAKAPSNASRGASATTKPKGGNGG